MPILFRHVRQRSLPRYASSAIIHLSLPAKPRARPPGQPSSQLLIFRPFLPRFRHEPLPDAWPPVWLLSRQRSLPKVLPFFQLQIYPIISLGSLPLSLTVSVRFPLPLLTASIPAPIVLGVLLHFLERCLPQLCCAATCPPSPFSRRRNQPIIWIF